MKKLWDKLDTQFLLGLSVGLAIGLIFYWLI